MGDVRTPSVRQMPVTAKLSRKFYDRLGEDIGVCDAAVTGRTYCGDGSTRVRERSG
jgi:hypothetical protein